MPRFPATPFLIAAALSLVHAMAAVPSAEASPRFTVVNETDKSMWVEIYDGNDSACVYPAKSKRLQAGERGTFGCKGRGKGQCKVEFKNSKKDICTDLDNTCLNSVAKIKDKSTIVVSKVDGEYRCLFAKS